MTRLTRNAATQVFVTVMTDILGVETNSPLSLALFQVGVQDILDLIGLNFAEIESLTYRPAPTDNDTTPVEIAVPIGQRNRVRLFKAWIGSIASLSGQMSLTTDQWNELTQEDFDSFRTSSSAIGYNPVAQAPTPRGAAGTGTYTYGLNDFRKGIRRDSSVYPVFKDDKHFNNWNRSVLSQARAHDVSDVFNSRFVPSTAESILLFKAKQEFVYSVFNRCVQTDTGKSIVREHDHDYNAQAVYTKLVQQATTSTKAKLSRDKLVIELTTSLLDSTWRGTHEGFVLMWKEKMRLLEDMTSSQYHYADEVKLSMLQNAVSLVSKLSQIRDINDNLVAVGSLPLDYTTYSDMLISACNQLDKDLEVPRNSKSNRTVNYSHFKEEDYFEQGYLDAGDEFFSKDKEQQDQRDISLHQAWTVLAAESSAHESGKGMPFLPKDLWNHPRSRTRVHSGKSGPKSPQKQHQRAIQPRSTTSGTLQQGPTTCEFSRISGREP
jgi:hypothetical protein